MGTRGAHWGGQATLQSLEVVFNVFNPLFPILLRKGKLRQIVRKVVWGKALNEADIRYLAKIGETSRIDLLRRRLEQHRLLMVQYRLLDFGYFRGLVLYSWLIALLTAMDQEQVDAQSYLEGVKIGAPDPSFTVDIMMDYTFFPHMAVRVGSHVYSFSTKLLERYSVAEYLEKSISELVHKRIGALANSSLFHRTFLVVRLQLSPEEYTRLHHRYERDYRLSTGYKYELFARDCSSMAYDCLREETDIDVPHYLTGAPDAALSYLKARYGSRIVSIYAFSQANRDTTTQVPMEPLSAEMARLRNGMITSIEAKLHILAFPFYLYKNFVESQHGAVFQMTEVTEAAPSRD
jgi:hypothetical protein